MPTTTGTAYLAQAMKAYEVDCVFFVPAIAIPSLVAMEEFGILRVMTHGEKAAAYMADGYARASGKVGVCMAQNVGAANLAAGLQDPYLAGTPIVAITGGPTPAGRYRNVYQEVDALKMYEPVTKFAGVVEKGERLPDLLRQAFRTATTGEPGPVHLELAGSSGQVLLEEFDVPDEPLADKRFVRYPAFRFEADPDAMRDALRELRRARKPLIVAGGGVTASGAQSEVCELAELLSVPVATSLDGKATIDEDSELSVGVVGSYSRECANEVLRRSDLIFYIGSHTGSQATLAWRIPPLNTTVIQLDISPEELGRNYRNKVSLMGDAKVTLRRMIEMAEPVSDRGDWLAEAKGVVDEWREEHAPRMNSDAVPMHPERLCRELTDSLPSDAVLLADTGNSGIWTGTIVELQRGQKYLRAAGTLGWSFPAAIGAKAATPERPVVCFTGDGGFYYHIAELETAVRYGINPVILVNNNQSLSQEIRSYYRFGQPDEQADQVRKMWKFSEMNFARLAESFGAAGFRVERPGEFAGTLSKALSCGKPAVLDVVTDMFAETGRSYA